jgi:hypothetical protein
MASKSVANGAATTAKDFFKFNAKYLIHPESTANGLLDDAQCWLSAATETVNTLAVELETDGSQTQANPRAASRMLWGVFHLLEMVNGAIGAAYMPGQGGVDAAVPDEHITTFDLFDKSVFQAWAKALADVITNCRSERCKPRTMGSADDLYDHLMKASAEAKA